MAVRTGSWPGRSPTGSHGSQRNNRDSVWAGQDRGPLRAVEGSRRSLPHPAAAQLEVSALSCPQGGQQPESTTTASVRAFANQGTPRELVALQGSCGGLAAGSLRHQYRNRRNDVAPVPGTNPVFRRPTRIWIRSAPGSASRLTEACVVLVRTIRHGGTTINRRSRAFAAVPKRKFRGTERGDLAGQSGTCLRASLCQSSRF